MSSATVEKAVCSDCISQSRHDWVSFWDKKQTMKERKNGVNEWKGKKG